MNLEKILESLAQGRIDINGAKTNIKKIFESRKNQIDGLLKKSSDVVHSLTENMPTKIEKLSNNLSQNFHSVAFSPHIPGVDAKLSLFRGNEISNDSIVSDNQVLGSQCFGVRFHDTSEFNQNKMTAVQLSEVSAARSNFSHNNLSLSRLHNFSLQEARFEDCKLTRSTLNDVSVSESDFISNKLTKSELSRTIVNESRLSGLSLQMTTMRDCEFTNCDIQGLEFEECELSECVFTNISLKNRTAIRITHKNLKGLSVHDCSSVEEFLAAIEAHPSSRETQVSETTVAATQAAPVQKENKMPKQEAASASAADAEPVTEKKTARANGAQASAKRAPKKASQTHGSKSPRKKATHSSAEPKA